MTVAWVAVVGALVGLSLSVFVIRAGVAPVRRELARIADELEVRNEAEYGGAETVGRRV